MIAEIITIGDELLIGQVVDTNAAWMAEQLNLIGIGVGRIVSIPDEGEAIKEALLEAEQRADLILMTGGLGPTKDDITKHTLCEYFDTTLVINREVEADIKAYFKLRGRAMLEMNTMQAALPKSCKVIRNRVGTASGMWFEKEGKIMVAMPGVPFEMKKMMKDELLPAFKAYFNPGAIVYKTVLTQGIGESYLAEIIVDWENSLEEDGITLAYLPSAGRVRLRLMAKGDDEEALTQKINKKVEELQALVPTYIYGYNTDKLEEIVGEHLRAKGVKLATAESCTGGYIAHLVTSIAGSSDYFEGTVVSYSNDVKMQMLGVEAGDLKAHGAVSQPVIEQMAKGALTRFNVDYAIATSGIAGPGGGSDEKPVGTVWIAVASKEGVRSKKHLFGDGRVRNIQRAANAGLHMLLRQLKEE